MLNEKNNTRTYVGLNNNETGCGDGVLLIYEYCHCQLTLNDSSPSFLVQSFDITIFTNFNGCVNVYLEKGEVRILVKLTSPFPILYNNATSSILNNEKI